MCCDKPATKNITSYETIGYSRCAIRLISVSDSRGLVDKGDDEKHNAFCAHKQWLCQQIDHEDIKALKLA